MVGPAFYLIPFHISPVIVPIGYQVPSDQVLVLTSGTGADSGGTLGGSFSRDFASSMATIHHSGSILNAGGTGYLVDSSMLANSGGSGGGAVPAPGSITKSMLSSEVLNDLNSSTPGPGTVTRSMLSSEVKADLNRTQNVAGTSEDLFTEAFVHICDPCWGVWHSWGLEGIPVTLRAPKVEGDFLPTSGTGAAAPFLERLVRNTSFPTSTPPGRRGL